MQEPAGGAAQGPNLCPVGRSVGSGPRCRFLRGSPLPALLLGGLPHLGLRQGRQGQLSGNAKLCQKARTLGLGKQLMENFFWDGSKQENEGVNIHLPVILMLRMLAIGLGLMPKIFVRVGYLRTMPEKWEKQASKHDQ